MQESELNFYDKIGNWDFSQIKYKSERLGNWEFFEKIKENTNEKSLCLDIGTGGGEKLLKKYPKVGMVIGTDFSAQMVETARKNLESYPSKKVKFVQMDSYNMAFPKELFDLVSARHTVIETKQIYEILKVGGILVVEGVDKKDCLEMKELFGRGQGFKDDISIAEKDYLEIKNAGFSEIEKVEILENEYYETPEDLMALLIKTPILCNFSEFDENPNLVHPQIEKDLFEKYVSEYQTEKGILLKRVSYGIIAKKIYT